MRISMVVVCGVGLVVLGTGLWKGGWLLLRLGLRWFVLVGGGVWCAPGSLCRVVFPAVTHFVSRRRLSPCHMRHTLFIRDGRGACAAQCRATHQQRASSIRAQAVHLFVSGGILMLPGMTVKAYLIQFVLWVFPLTCAAFVFGVSIARLRFLVAGFA